MGSTARRVLVVGGNGFIGSAVCRAALSRGYEVTSVSSSGNPYRTPKGHTPAWVANVDWQTGDAFNPDTFAHLFPQVDGVVHTLGILLEDGEYKQAVRDANIPQLLSSLFWSVTGDTGNPLRRGSSAGSDRTTYESMNKKAALQVCEAFISSSPPPETEDLNDPRPFIYVSAEDIFRPLIPARYIETKREAEQEIEDMIAVKPGYRGVYIRPSLVYHAHYRPLTTPAAALLDLSAMLHRKVPQGIPTPSSVIRTLASTSQYCCGRGTVSSSLESIANAFVIPPIHVDQVAEAICATLDSRSGIKGVVDTRRMRELIGWPKEARKSSFDLAA
jgi:nucleoside-diphosphate-sugar epimerase